MNSPDNSSDRARWRELIERHLHGNLTADEARELEAALAAHREARAAFRLRCNVDATLRKEALALEQDGEAAAGPGRAKVSSGWLSWFAFRPFAAAAAGLVVGLFAASAAFAWSLPKPVRHALALANPGFEEVPTAWEEEEARRVNRWGGEGEVVAVTGGMPAREGGRAMRFTPVRQVARPSGAVNAGAAVSQVVDVREFRALLAGGMAMVQWSAAFNGAPDAERGRTVYRVDVRAYAGAADVLQRPWPERLEQQVAHSMSRAEADGDASAWQTVSGTMILPRDTDFLLIELKLFQAGPRAEAAAARAPHFADDIQLSLVTGGGKNLLTHTARTP